MITVQLTEAVNKMGVEKLTAMNLSTPPKKLLLLCHSTILNL
jgi:hypothetical protein